MVTPALRPIQRCVVCGRRIPDPVLTTLGILCLGCVSERRLEREAVRVLQRVRVATA